MPKALHQSWIDLSAGVPDDGSSIVRFDFSGTFSEGSHEGTVFAGRIEYDLATPATEHHPSFAIYGQWPAPIVIIAVGGQVLTSAGAAVYDRVDDGRGGHFDFVTMFGTGQIAQQQQSFFELLFSAEGMSMLDGTQMPSARQLQNMPLKQVSFGTSDPADVISRGDLMLHPAG